MRMSAEQQIEIGMRRLAIDLGRMRQQDRKFVVGELGRSLFDIVEPIVVSVIDTGQMEALIAALEHFGFVEQHANAHLFQLGDHADRIMVAQHAVDRGDDMRTHPCHPRDGCTERPVGFPTIIAGQYAKVVR